MPRLKRVSIGVRTPRRQRELNKKRQQAKASKEMDNKANTHNIGTQPYETIAIDSDSENSSAGEDDSHSQSNFNDSNQTSKSSAADKSTDEVAKQELKKLSLDVHGTFMADFDPEKSKREIRKMNRRLNSKGSKRCRLYDEKGLLLENLMDICDCLEKDCPGCHFPCPRCDSSKCGTNCRSNRKYTIDYIELEGTDKRISFPSFEK